jgi:hypothetical protein
MPRFQLEPSQVADLMAYFKNARAVMSGRDKKERK